MSWEMELNIKCRKMMGLANETLALSLETIQTVYSIYNLRKQPLTNQEAVAIALSRKVYFSFEALVDDAGNMKSEAIHHLKTMAECLIYFYYVVNNNDAEAQRVLCEMAINKKKFIDNNSDYSSATAQSIYWDGVVESYGNIGISVKNAADKGSAMATYNRIYRLACEPAHLADLHEYLPEPDSMLELNKSAVSPIWVSTALFQAMELAITILTDVSQFFKLNIENRLNEIKSNKEKVMFSSNP